MRYCVRKLPRIGAFTWPDAGLKINREPPSLNPKAVSLFATTIVKDGLPETSTPRCARRIEGRKLESYEYAALRRR